VSTLSVHVRAVITWLAIFPLVVAGMELTEPFTHEWPSVLRALLLTVVVVPLAVYLVVPRLSALYARIVAYSVRGSAGSSEGLIARVGCSSPCGNTRDQRHNPCSG
jgi:hypothetical protein